MNEHDDGAVGMALYAGSHVAESALTAVAFRHRKNPGFKVQ
jgi:hypothetical protein